MPNPRKIHLEGSAQNARIILRTCNDSISSILYFALPIISTLACASTNSGTDSTCTPQWVCGTKRKRPARPGR
jgi:hypothetical protein